MWQTSEDEVHPGGPPSSPVVAHGGGATLVRFSGGEGEGPESRCLTLC
jgi:hypothetical protein